MGGATCVLKYNMAIVAEAERAFQYLTDLSGNEAIVEIKKVSPKRSLRQNSYLHLLLQAFGSHFGYTLAESKLIYKELNANIYSYKKKHRTFYRSSADLTKDEMMNSIERFREKSAEQGYPLPTATDQEWLRSLENTIQQTEKYL